MATEPIEAHSYDNDADKDHVGDGWDHINVYLLIGLEVFDIDAAIGSAYS